MVAMTMAEECQDMTTDSEYPIVPIETYQDAHTRPSQMHNVTLLNHYCHYTIVWAVEKFQPYRTIVHFETDHQLLKYLS